MESSAVADCLRDKCILITGSTGYLGKLLVEKILRVQPVVKKLYLLVRAPDATSAEQRVLSEVIGKDPFNLLREKYGITGFHNFIKEKVVPLAGDIVDGYLGLHNSRVHALSEEIDVIINVAETTNFFERCVRHGDDVAVVSATEDHMAEVEPVAAAKSS
ncbi:fatty acyl-CoA reductase 8-like [Aegilops tauschii subsp. strangulata]|uniref:fatty acyl-CoA reductase 8-like n=1 Tax=Aegilops tauschii subsp. strangulata TaxID=200361 RepID=UPI001E1CA92E|nr:fatty acyl-CoA reductase 8-like [Aegilops tauschii subsp. strangulata]